MGTTSTDLFWPALAGITVIALIIVTAIALHGVIDSRRRRALRAEAIRHGGS